MSAAKQYWISSQQTEEPVLANNFVVLASDYNALAAECKRLAGCSDSWERLSAHNRAISDSFQTERDRLQAEVAGLAAVRSIVDQWLAPDGISDRQAMVEIARCIRSVAR